MTDDELLAIILDNGADATVEDIQDAYLDYTTWAHDFGHYQPTMEEWLPASGWLE